MKLAGCVEHGSAAPGEVILAYTGLWGNRPLLSLGKPEKTLLIAAFQVCLAFTCIFRSAVVFLGKRMDSSPVRT